MKSTLVMIARQYFLLKYYRFSNENVFVAFELCLISHLDVQVFLLKHLYNIVKFLIVNMDTQFINLLISFVSRPLKEFLLKITFVLSLFVCLHFIPECLSEL